MICRMLLLLILSSCVCAATFVVNVTQSSYQAEEKHNITLEWTFTTTPASSSNSLFIYCELLTDLQSKCLYHRENGDEVAESQDEEFAGRVQSDEDVLREGRIRLHVSRLRTNDSGLYVCGVHTDFGFSSGRCRLYVTEVKNQPEPERKPDTPKTAGQENVGLFCGLLLAFDGILLGAFYTFTMRLKDKLFNVPFETKDGSAAKIRLISPLDVL